MKIKLGQVVTTSAIHADIAESVQFAGEVARALARYTSGDWGEVSNYDKEANDYAAENGERILASYETSKGKIWIITEWDRSATTILYPEEY